MKKTVSVNIKGINFLIEEDAYELLQDYMDRLKKTLQNETGSKEIIEDVELRIAEICSSKLNENKTVIELEDIEEILSQLGDPSDYVDEDQSTSSHSKSYNEGPEKRLFRDTENAVIAGVCQGIANFFNIDVVIIRALFVIILLFAGFGFPLYLILWIIVPKAKNTIDRLRMKGRPITVETVREEVELAAERIKGSSKNFAGKIRNEGSAYSRGISRVGRIITTIVGIGIIIWGLTWLVSLLVFVFGGFEFIPIIGENGFLSISEAASLVLTDPGDTSLGWTAAILVGFGATLFLLLLGTMLIVRLKNKWAKLSLLALFLMAATGGIMGLYVGMKTGRDFALNREIEYSIGTASTDQLVVKPQLNVESSHGNYTVKRNRFSGLIGVDEENITFQGIRFRYKKSADSLFHIYQSKSARSQSNSRGLERAENIDHMMIMRNDTLFVDTEFSFPREDKIRDQDVTVIIEIPDSSSVKLKDRVINLQKSIEEEEEDEYLYYRERGRLRGNGEYRHYRYYRD